MNGTTSEAMEMEPETEFKARVLSVSVPPTMQPDALAEVQIKPCETQADADLLGRIYKQISEKIKAIGARYADAKQKAHAMHKAVVKLETDEAAPFVALRDLCETNLLGWKAREGRRIADAKAVEEKRLAEEARKKREEEEAQARQAREAEANKRAKEEEARKAAEAGDIAAQLKAEGEAEIFNAIAEESHAEAAALAQEAAIAETAPVAIVQAKTAGISTPDKWETEITDFAEFFLSFARGVESGAIPKGSIPEIFEAKKAGLNSLAKTWKEGLAKKFKGARAVNNVSIRAGQ